MRDIDSFDEIYLYRQPVDMRKYRNGLCQIVRADLGMSVFSPTLFVFCNRVKTIIRFLYWDDTGFAVWSKTLDKQRYKWPSRRFEGEGLNLTTEHLRNLLTGMDVTLHKKLEYEDVF